MKFYVQLIPSTSGRPIVAVIVRNTIRWAWRLPSWCLRWVRSGR
jgi:hypothetical protein